jgi:tRNA1(Val) A37 N6-methylase TrmN6
MSAAGQFLRRVRTNFERHAILFEPQIVEYLAFLLLQHDQWSLLDDAGFNDFVRMLETSYREYQIAYPRLRIPSIFPVDHFTPDEIRELLYLLAQAIQIPFYENNLGKFFQREIRWEMLKSSTDSQYPTPYHIAAFMAKLGVTSSDAKVLDPTMGSAGLLIAALSEAPDATLVGADFDPLWAAIGSTNLILHGKEDAAVFVGSCLEKFSRDAVDLPDLDHWNGLFDTVLMNPPFGGARSPYEVEEAIGAEFGRNNATVMGGLALQALAPGGRAIFLTPSGTLFASRGAEVNLKTAMLNESLESIVTLPKQAFYPFSNTEAHLVVVRKRAENEANPANPIWFCKVEADGYPEGAGRDLTTPSNAHTDELPRVQELILNTRQPDAWHTQLNLDRVGSVQTTSLAPDGLSGLGLRMTEDVQKPKWEILALANRSLIKIRDQAKRLQGWLSIEYPHGETVALTSGQVDAHNFTILLAQEDWVEEFVGNWKNEVPESSLQVQADQELQFILKQKQTEYRFSQQDEHTEMACVLGDDGQPKLPWLHLMDVKKIRDEEFGQRFAATPLYDAGETQFGWLLDFSQTQADDDDEPQNIKLLIVFQDQIELFENNDVIYGFTYNGYFQIRDGAFLAEQGQPIRLQQDTVGFAIGPNAGSSFGQRVFATLLSRSAIVANENLQPARFLPEPEAPPLEHPASVIAKIRKNQNKLSNRIDTILGILGNTSKQTPDRDQAYPIPDWIIEMLDEQQKALWQAIAARQVDARPAHFNTKDLLAWKAELGEGVSYSDADALMQLELFTRLGLIMKVRNQGENLYRCLTNQDVLKPQLANPEEEHEAA